MVRNCAFIQLLADEDKGAALIDTINKQKTGVLSSAFFPIAPEKFSMVPGSPFAYWVSDKIRRLFLDLPTFEGNGRTVKQGIATADDFRFVRAWWEVDPSQIVSGTPGTTPDEFRSQTFNGRKWAPFAKGGEYSPYYADLHLVLNWERDGEEIRNFIDPSSGKVLSRPQNTEYYFQPGLTYPRRLHRLAVMPLPKGSIISVRGSGIFTEFDDISITAALFSSKIFDFLVKTMLGRFNHPQFDNGTLCYTPIPSNFYNNSNELKEIIEQSIKLKQNIDSFDEITHSFIIYGDLFKNIISNIQIFEDQNKKIRSTNNQILFNQEKIDSIINSLYQLSSDEIECINKYIKTGDVSKGLIPNTGAPINTAIYLISYIFGSIFGRWDIRFATGEKEPPELPDPFAPLPACSPGMLQGEDGLPLEPHEIPADYPLEVDADGILVDDEGHSDDIIARIRDVITVVWGDRADAIEKEACDILAVKSLWDYFRKPTAGGFWDDHVKRYSKSRRKAPIYWLLQSAKKNYAIWIYYP
ncbi:hypothetical protein, partial [Methanocalculus sp.]|uniref:hypothetical protein n=1 Tax=Methanocalculus sp. TaxID=2004547 RepID=UPI00262914C6